MISKGHAKLSIAKQCELLTVSRSGLYKPALGESKLNLELMAHMDKHYLIHPYKGVPRMHVYLTKDLGYKINIKRTERLFGTVMGLQAIIPGPHTSKGAKNHKIYPYLLGGMQITRVNQVWATDITYIPMAKGFMYLMAIIDLHSRYVVHWSVSNTMDADWCAQTLKEALEKGVKPEIFNTDQGSQFTSNIFTTVLQEHGIQISMDGKGRATDNAFIERLWRSVKYERIYLIIPEDGSHLYRLLNDYFKWYNYKRRHSSLEDYYPADLYYNQQKVAA